MPGKALWGKIELPKEKPAWAGRVKGGSVLYAEKRDDPTTLSHIQHKCKYCHREQTFDQIERMSWRPTKRSGESGQLEHWSYRCSNCGGLLVVGYWRKGAGSEQGGFFDSELWWSG